MTQSELSENLDGPILFQPEAEKDKIEGQVIRYSGEKYLSVAENDEGLTAILEDALSNCQEIPFMAIDHEGSSKKINGKYHYVLCLFGTLINGQKAVVILLGIQVFFDVFVPDGESPDECEIKIRDILSDSVKTFLVEHIKAFPFRGYHTEKKSYLRIYTNSTGSRKTAIKAVQDNNFETASDDLYSFHHKVARENALLRDRTLVLIWDIETQSQELGKFAEVLDQENKIFMICMTLHWKDNPKPLKQICLVDVETIPDPEWITIICGNQVNLLKGFALCWQAFASDIHIGFNDSNYDWPFIVKRAYHINILEWMWERMTGKLEMKEEILKIIVKGTEEGEEDPEEKEYMGGPIKIKISAEEDFTSSFLKLPGCVPIDIRVYLKKRFSRSEVEKEGSLKFFLEKCGLVSKADMPYDKMWKIYSEVKKSSSLSTVRNMHEVADYCIIDPLRCQELLVKLRQINDYREVASIAYVSLFDSHYRVNGMKVRNLLGAYAFKRDMVISTRIPENTEKVKYPGAYIFPPKKGIEMRRPVAGLDFASLYPSLIMAYNLSPDKIILTHREADIAQNNGSKLHKIEFPFNNCTIQAWSRVELKSQLALLGKKKVQLGKMISFAKKRGKRISESLNLEYSSYGNSKSPIFLCELAGGTTLARKYNLNLVAEFVTKKGFGIKYELSKEAYWTKMVKITMNVMKSLCDQINVYLSIKSGTSYLKMAYEEVLFPVCFTGKKEYFGVGHEDEDELLKFIGERIMREAMDINNTCSIHKIVEDTLREAQNKEWNFNDFIRIPNLGERFSYVVIKGLPLYNEQGRKVPHRVGDYMEYVDIAKERNMEIDINYYLGTMVGICVCFINEDDSFLPPLSDKTMQIKDLDKKEKQIDVYSQNEAKKWLKKYIKTLQ
ncbi:ribonuclease H-like domain-containing protein [Gigaspora rosea]|uniref:DNA polymerase delta catalytic subunit n=1 Tax=Gigaspora rosea TaxID=44941 RepID=A0A397VD66_9GLOM|nr:ribonuclease H-like domain-containing protein [Gigaspora rosea]